MRLSYFYNLNQKKIKIKVILVKRGVFYWSADNVHTVVYGMHFVYKHRCSDRL